MKLILALVATFGLAAVAHAANESFASANCSAGCQIVSEMVDGQAVYVGTTPKRYRICTSDGYEVAVFVEQQKVATLESRNGSMPCMDVEGKSIGIAGQGRAAVGAVGS